MVMPQLQTNNNNQAQSTIDQSFYYEMQNQYQNVFDNPPPVNFRHKRRFTDDPKILQYIMHNDIAVPAGSNQDWVDNFLDLENNQNDNY